MTRRISTARIGAAFPLFVSVRSMPPIRSIPRAYIRVLRSSTQSDIIPRIKLTKKGGLPAQTVKRVVLGRLASVAMPGSLRHVRGDTYGCRFAQSTFRSASPLRHPGNLSLGSISHSLKRRRSRLMVLCFSSFGTAMTMINGAGSFTSFVFLPTNSSQASNTTLQRFSGRS